MFLFLLAAVVAKPTIFDFVLNLLKIVGLISGLFGCLFGGVVGATSLQNFRRSRALNPTPPTSRQPQRFPADAASSKDVQTCDSLCW